MGILDNFEKGLERAVNGAFAKTFRSGLQPVELTSALRRELDTKAAVVTRDRTLAPNKFTLRMSPDDHERMASMGAALTDELTSFVQQHAMAQGYQFAGGISIRLAADESLSEGILRVDSENVKGRVAWTPVLDVAGTRHPLHTGRTVIGRGREADITLDDTGASRKHAEVAWDGSRAHVRDLGSTNGTQLDGRKLTGSSPLEPDSVITIGRSRLVFRVLPQAADEPSRSMPAGDNFWGSS